jgi:hypothetical protein
MWYNDSIDLLNNNINNMKEDFEIPGLSPEEIEANMEKIEPKYMMATTSIFPSGVIVEGPGPAELCIVSGILEFNGNKYYVGEFSEGIRVSSMRFPFDTVRDLTQEERERLDGTGVSIGGTKISTIHTKR